MNAVNAILARLVDAALAPMAAWPWWVGVAVVTFVITLIAMPIIKWTLNPSLADRMKRNLHASIFELRLFNDSLPATFRAIFGMLRWTGGYLGSWLLPILIMAVPMLPLFSHLHAHYGYQGLEIGEPVTVTAKIDTESFSLEDHAKPNLQLIASDGVEIETPALWVATRKEAIWRIHPTVSGEHQLTVKVNGEEATKTLAVLDGTARRSPVRPGNFLDQLLYPSEPSLNGAVKEISVPYPETPIVLLLPLWVWALLLFSIPIALLLKKPFKVEF